MKTNIRIIVKFHLYKLQISQEAVSKLTHWTTESILFLVGGSLESPQWLPLAFCPKILAGGLNLWMILLYECSWSGVDIRGGGDTQPLLVVKKCRWYKARHTHKCLYTVLPKYSKIQVLSGITSCRLMRDNKQAIELNDLLMKWHCQRLLLK